MNQLKTFVLNGKSYCVKESICLLDLLVYLDYKQSLFVLEYNNFICSKKKWDKVFIQNKDKIEIVTIVGGG